METACEDAHCGDDRRVRRSYGPACCRDYRLGWCFRGGKDKEREKETRQEIQEAHQEAPSLHANVRAATPRRLFAAERSPPAVTARRRRSLLRSRRDPRPLVHLHPRHDLV